MSHRGNTYAQLVEDAGRDAVLRGAAYAQMYTDEGWVEAVEYSEHGDWITLTGKGLREALDAAEEALREELRRDRAAKAATFVPEPQATVWVLPPEARPSSTRWEVLRVFAGPGAPGEAVALAAGLGIPADRIRIDVGETRP